MAADRPAINVFGSDIYKQEMEKEMLRLRSKEEQMVLELQQENLLRLEQLKRLRAE